jgi:subtilisin family serine protease
VRQKFDDLISKASIRGAVPVIVGLRFDLTPEGYLNNASRENQRTEIKRKGASILQQLETFSPRNVIQFKTIPYLGMTVDVDTLEFLKASPDIVSIREDEYNELSLAESVPQVNAPRAWDLGFSGQGQVIAVLDTGVDRNHPFLSGKVLAEACFSRNDTQLRVASLCPDGATQSFALGSARPCEVATKDDACSHGTHVAGIAAGRDPAGRVYGVARDAGLVAVQVSEVVNCGEPLLCVKPSDTNYMRGLEYVLDLKHSGLNVAAANLSLGSSSFSDTCDGQFRDLAELFSNLQSAGVAVVVAAGNGGLKDAVQKPACLSSAVSVGSVGDGSPGPQEAAPDNTPVPADAVVDTSNSVRFLSLLAPGRWIESSVPGGGYQRMSGTSMAAPHVAGAWAILKSRVPDASVPEVLDALRYTGLQVSDPKSGIVTPRIDIGGALQALTSCGYTLSSLAHFAAATGGPASFGVTVPAGCGWEATSNVNWVTTNSGGNGSGTVTFTVAANTGAARAGKITVGGQVFNINQASSGGGVIDNTRVFAADGVLSGFFGYSVSISGDTAVVGAPGDDVGGNLDQGSAYVFVRTGTGWLLQQKLTVGDGAASDQFGWTVSINGGTLLVGAPGDDVGANVNQGSVYVFTRSSTAWTLRQKLVQGDGSAEDSFGWSVAVEGDTAVVGAYHDDDAGQQDTGSAYVFVRSNSFWLPQVKFLLGDRASRSELGYSVGLSGQTVIISARFDGIGQTTPDLGAAYVFTRSGTIWTFQAKLVASDRGAGDHFGYSVSISGDTVVVGSRFSDIGAARDQGAAYVYARSGTLWAFQAKLTASDGAAGDEFGISASVFGNSVVVGASQNPTKKGKAYFFSRNGSVWTQRAALVAPDGAADDLFGVSVALNAETAIVGAAFDNTRRGSAYFFSPLTVPAASTVQFGSAAYSVGESAWKVLVTVTRTGSTAAAASVDFATEDKTASRRLDYTQSLGTLNFGVGETSKTLIIFVTNDVLPESPETFTITLSEAVGAALGAITTTTVTINSDDTVAGPNPLAGTFFSPDFFVRQHYVDFLNREADASGLSFWGSNFTQCAGNQSCLELRRVNVSAAFFLSIEFQETGYLAYRMYKAAYGDTTSKGVPGTVPIIRLDEFLSDTRRIGQGVVVGVGSWQPQLEANKSAFAAEFVGRTRFINSFPALMTPTQFVDKLDVNAGRVLSPAQRSQLIAEVAANNTPSGRAAVLRKMAENANLSNNELRRAFVLMQYFGYLRRNPDDSPEPGLNYGGWKFWLDKLNQFNGSYVEAEMVKAFITSDEYRHRFSQ